MSEKPVSRPYSVRNQIRWLLNNELFSDVAFLIGGKKVFAHKNIVSLGSDAFAGMLYGPMKEERSEIEILDVEYEGFLNVIKYLYGFEISEVADNLAHLSSTYMVADRYLVQHLKEGLIEHIKSVLDPSNGLMIYDQLLKLPAEETALQSALQVRRFVQQQTELDFDISPNISQATLINLLSLEWLALSEIDVLKACDSWAEAEASRKGPTPNSKAKSTICSSFKHLILFAELSIEDLTDFPNLKDFLTAEEVGHLFLHLSNKTDYPLKIKCKTSRRTFEEEVIDAECDTKPAAGRISSLTTLVNVNRKTFLSRIRTSLSWNIVKLWFSITSGNEVLKSSGDRARFKVIYDKGYWTIELREIYELDPAKTYSFAFKFAKCQLTGFLSSQTKLESDTEDDSLVFTLNFEHPHCIKELVFLTLV